VVVEIGAGASKLRCPFARLNVGSHRYYVFEFQCVSLRSHQCVSADTLS
jgi:hypothetical protein